MRSELRRILLKLLADQGSGLTPMQMAMMLLWSPQRVVDVLDRAQASRMVQADDSEPPRWIITSEGLSWLARIDLEEA